MMRTSKHPKPLKLPVVAMFLSFVATLRAALIIDK
tara:strand:- start:729 stop:833 length:105 start_codon:yes stop_codon:yes gene_type:complete